MGFSRIKTRGTIGVGLCVAVLVVVFAAAGTVIAAPTTQSLRLKRVIVVLRNRNPGLAARSARRRAAVRAEQAPIVAALSAAGARNIVAARVLNFVVATVSAGEASRLAANPAVAQVIPDAVIPGPSPATPLGPFSRRSHSSATAAAPCGTAASPELDPEALTNINDRPSQLPAGIDGAGVTVAYIADGVDPSNPDFQRNAAYASSGSPAGSPVVTQSNFTGDPAGTPTVGGEAFLDASSIAAQGNRIYDLSQYVSSAHPLPSGCDIKIVGAAPGARVMGLNVFGTNYEFTTSNWLQAIDYAAANGAKVVNESFGSNDFPDTALDATRQADDAAVGAGVTVVVSSGDAGITSTIGSPASDPAMISVGASTTFRAYRQVTAGGINDPHVNGNWVDDNISAFSSGGFTQSGDTVNLVAPGDINWALCNPDLDQFSACADENGSGSPIQLTGGTSESAPLTAGAAADVIQAYASTHRGSDPSPALVKQILTSTATDIGAPASQQGAGLLNVAAAVRQAESIAGTAVTPSGGLRVSPSQINVAQQPGASTTRAISVTNTGSSPVTVRLSTRTLSAKVSDQSGSFCMQPGAAPIACYPANTGTFPGQSGVTEVYQEQTFTVPATSGPSRLKFAADYQDRGQTSPIQLALLEPDGTYAAYSAPQGLAHYAEVEVANPPAGKWTAVFFTAQDSGGLVGTSGPVQWDASTWQYAPGGSISPSSLQIGAGQTLTAQLRLAGPTTAGDSEQSVLLSGAGAQTTVPVTVRTLVPTTGGGGTFSGVLTGGNGRPDAPAQTNAYYFNVPSGKRDLEASVTLASDPEEELIAFLVDPNGQTVGYSSNDTVDSSGKPTATQSVTLYHVAPQAGRWSLVLEWFNPVTGYELSEPFTGSIGFDRVSVHSNLPAGVSTKLTRGQAYTFHVRVTNTDVAPESFFVDPRLGQTAAIRLRDQAGSDSNMTLPLTGPPPFYFIPTHTTALQAKLAGSVPVTFDMSYLPAGDPDVSPVLSGGPVSGSQTGDSASLTLTEPEIAPGFWALLPSEIGPYPASGAPAATASASLSAVTSAFDPTVTSTTGDFWSWANGLSSTFAPLYAPPGGSADITVTVTPTAAPGTNVSGTLYVDDIVTSKLASSDGDELAAIPYSYQVK